MKAAIASSFARAGTVARVDLGDHREHHVPALEEDGVEDLVLGLEVVVDEPVGDARLVGHVATPGSGRSPGGRRRAPRRRGSGAACRRPRPGAPRRSRRRSLRASGRPRPGGWPARAAARGPRRAFARSRSATIDRLGVRRLREHDAPGIDDQRAPARVRCPRPDDADLVGGDDVGLVLDRPCAQQDLPVVARGREREGGGHEQHARAAQREDPVELGEAQVVADAQAQLDAAGRAATRRSPRPGPRGRTRGTRVPATSTSNRCSLR